MNSAMTRRNFVGASAAVAAGLGAVAALTAPVAAQAVRHNQAQAVLPLPEKADGVFVFLPASRVGINCYLKHGCFPTLFVELIRTGG